MTIKRLDHVSIVVDDLEAAIAFFTALGMEVEGEAPIEGQSVDAVNALDGVRVNIAMMRTPDGNGKLEVTKFHHPTAIRAEPADTPSNAFGLRSIMFAVDDIDDVVTRLRRHGGELVREIAQYEDIYRVCFVRAPEGFVIGLGERLG
ncbi:MAG TPA: VOC family protein [Gaiellales bacterium]|nr:VOC family protein [Gaiellales bacterium]